VRHLPPPPRGRCIVVGAGKASAAMAAAVDAAWLDVDLGGVVSTRYGHALPAGRVQVIEAGHPVPDGNSVAAAEAMLAAVAGLGPDDLVLALVSGGGSACLALPAPGITLPEKQALTRALLHSGAPIAEMNTVRRHASAIKGGRLAAAAWPAKVVTLLVSDVPGDDPAAVASGPTLADATTPGDALAVIERHGIAIPEALRRALMMPGGAPSPADNGPWTLVATPGQALAAAAAHARVNGVTAIVLGDDIQGESADVGRAMAADVLSRKARGEGPLVLLSGGETTVTIGSGGGGRGGRNCEFLLALALALDGAPGIHALAADTDGIDGTEDAAGALIGPDSLRRAVGAGLDPAEMLAGHDSYSLFAATGDLLVTGPTHTNVNDFRVLLLVS
jgi:glycerate 2-kinase